MKAGVPAGIPGRVVQILAHAPEHYVGFVAGAASGIRLHYIPRLKKKKEEQGGGKDDDEKKEEEVEE